MNKETFIKHRPRAKQRTAKEAKTGTDKRWTKRYPYLDKVRGGLSSGAIGAALGYPIEFMSWKAIQKKYGADGIQKYDNNFETVAAVFSDDTQMSLFTSYRILIGETQGHLKGIQGAIANYVHIGL